jgi:hypothetical protein
MQMFDHFGQHKHCALVGVICAVIHEGLRDGVD